MHLSPADAAAVIPLYDYFITFSDEVRLIWKNASLKARLIFFAVRYLTLLAVRVGYFSLTDVSLAHVALDHQRFVCPYVCFL